MTITYRQAIAPKIEPVLIEERLEAALGDGWRVSGQLDALSQSPGALHDLKTGTRQRSNIVQYGTYAMLFGAHGYDVTTIVEDYLPRVAIDKPQPDPFSTVISLDAAIAEAYTLIQDVKRQTAAFVDMLENGGAPPFSAFRANPNSALCSDRYCPAWGTTFCRAHLGAV